MLFRKWAWQKQSTPLQQEKEQSFDEQRIESRVLKLQLLNVPDNKMQ